MARIYALHGKEHWMFRDMSTGLEAKAAALLPLPEARRIVVNELDAIFGRRGWTFAN